MLTAKSPSGRVAAEQLLERRSGASGKGDGMGLTVCVCVCVCVRVRVFEMNMLKKRK